MVRPDPLEQLRESLAQRYRVERELGRGGMAVVYLATDLKHGREVAIKVLQPDVAASVGAARFLREIEIAAKLQHPHILPVYDSGDAGGLLYYVMPRVAGESLRDRIAHAGPLLPGEAMEIAREVADALAYAHRQGIVHRDIKPANILLSQGHAQVADFGIARAISSSVGPGLTQAGSAVGTPYYMSPEQAVGSTNLDGRADVYALGCVLYEMLAGRVPYQGTTPQAVIAQAISAPTPKLPTSAVGLQGVIDKAMAKEPSARFGTAEEFSAALRAPTSVPTARAHRRPLIVAGVAVVLALAAVILWPRGYRVAGDPRKSLIVFPFDNRTGETEDDYLQEASLNLLTLAVSHWEDLRVFDDERTASLLRRRGVKSPRDLDFDLARALAKDARVGTLVLGDIRAEGDSLLVEGKVHDVRTGDRLATEIVKAPRGADPRPLFDSLAARILRVSGATAGERPELVAQTTRSLDAYRAYLRGVEELQQFTIDSARIYLERAVALDSTFALAYLRLRDVDGWAGLEAEPEQRHTWVAKANANSGSLPPRLRALVQFHVAYDAEEYGRARAIVERLIVRDSGDTEAWYQLGEAHFHGRAIQFPHPDGAGNVGRALAAFRRALATNPSYVLAYQHITDALGQCAAVDTPWLCLADSAVYAEPAELNRRFGVAQVARLRREAREARLAAATEWTEAAPRSTRARTTLMGILLLDNRVDEARTQVTALRANGEVTLARVWESFLQLREQHYADAADTVRAAFPDRRGFMRAISGMGPDAVVAGLLAGGRQRAAEAVRDELLASVSGSNAPIGGPGNAPLTPAALALVLDLRVAGELGLDSALQRRLARRWLDTVDSLFARDSTRRQQAITGSGSLVLAAYLGSRDTTILTRFLATTDTATSLTWHVMDALLALARGDTARAQRRIQRHYRGADSVEFTGAPGAVRTMAWGDLLARLGNYPAAVTAFQRMDSTSARLSRPAMHVRSWAERGALYQQMGDTALAIDMYEKVIAAWERGDELVQPVVERARMAVRVLRGEAPAPPRR